jgi:ABC-type amino acid transport substrate-binding protein
MIIVITKVCMKKFLFILLMLSISTIIFSSDGILMITEDFPPLNYLADTKLTGPSVEIVREIAKSVNPTEEITVMPWSRGLALLKQDSNVCLFSMARTKQRENQFKWVGPIATKKYGFLAKKSRNLKINSLDNAKLYYVGAQQGGVTEEFLLAHSFKNIDYATDPVLNFRKLNAGRIDLWYTSSTTPIILAKSENIDINNFEMVFVAEETDLYIGFNIKTPDSVISKWQNAYDDLYKKGIIRDIYKKYNMIDLYPQ